MKTIQQLLCKLNARDIRKAYFQKYPIHLNEVNGFDEMTIGDFKKRVNRKFREFLQRVRNVQVTEKPEKQGVLFLSDTMFCHDDSEWELGLVFVDDLLKSDDPYTIPLYSIILIEWKDVLGYYVADVSTTQDNLMELVVQFLYEISWFGYQEESIVKEKKALQKGKIVATERPGVRSGQSEVFGSLDQAIGSSGCYTAPNPDKTEKLNEVYKAIGAYNRYFRAKELEQIKTVLSNDTKDER